MVEHGDGKKVIKEILIMSLSKCFRFIGNLLNNDVTYNSDVPLYGFQFAINGVELTDASSEFESGISTLPT